MTASAQGADISAYQPRLNAAAIQGAGISFAFVKATNGTAPEDPEFAASWAALATAGLHRGAYHELTTEDPDVQALHFMNVVTGRGLRPGDLLAVVGTDYPVSGEQVKSFADKAAQIAGPHCPVIVYASLSRLPDLAPASGYPLWVAAWRSSAPADVAPWPKWTFWQRRSGGGADGGDLDVFNGTAAELDAWIAAHAGTAPVPPPADWAFRTVRYLKGTAGPDSVRLTWDSPDGPSPGAVHHYQVTFRKQGQDVHGFPVDVPKGPNPESHKFDLKPGTYDEALVRAATADGSHASQWAEVTFPAG